MPDGKSDDRLKSYVAVLAAILTAGQLFVAAVNYNAVVRKNSSDLELNRLTHQENLEKADRERKLSDATYNRDLLRLLLDKMGDLQKSSELRNTFTTLGADLPPSPTRIAIVKAVLNSVPPKDKVEFDNLSERLTPRKDSGTTIVFIHYSTAAGIGCANRIAKQLNEQGVVARVDQLPTKTGPNRLDYFNGDLTGAQRLMNLLAPAFTSPPKLNAEPMANKSNFFGLWIEECNLVMESAPKAS